MINSNSPWPGTSNRRGAARRQGFTLIELLVVIAILAVLAGLTMPAVSGARDRAKAINCVSNLKVIGAAAILYAADNGGRLPPICGLPYADAWSSAAVDKWWPSLLAPYLGSKDASTAKTRSEVWRCPEVADADITTDSGKINHYGYGGCKPIINFISSSQGSKVLAELTHPARLWMFGDIGKPKIAPSGDRVPTGGYTTVGAIDQLYDSPWALKNQPACRHGNGTKANFIACDGHVESWPWQDLRAQKNGVFGWDPQTRQMSF